MRASRNAHFVPKPRARAAVQASEPSVLYYWAKLKYRLTLTDVSGAGDASVVMLVFKKVMNAVGVGVLAVGVGVAVTG